MEDPLLNKHVDDLSHRMGLGTCFNENKMAASNRQSGQSINFIKWILATSVQKITASSPEALKTCSNKKSETCFNIKKVASA
jgi:hypothetical protein